MKGTAARRLSILAALAAGLLLWGCSGVPLWPGPSGGGIGPGTGPGSDLNLGTGSKPAGEILVAAPASLTDALTEIAHLFREEASDIDIKFIFGASGSLRSQIKAGAPIDMFISAAREPMEDLKEGGFTASGSGEVLATNTLVLAAHGETAGDYDGWGALLHGGVTRVAMGNPYHVPAGTYGRQALKDLGMWDRVASKAVYGEDVRQVMNFVETGNAQVGIVYSTDVGRAAPGTVTVIAPAPEGSHDPIIYPMALMKESPNPKAAAAFFEFLKTEKAKEVLNRHGFGIPEGS